MIGIAPRRSGSRWRSPSKAVACRDTTAAKQVAPTEVARRGQAPSFAEGHRPRLSAGPRTPPTTRRRRAGHSLQRQADGYRQARSSSSVLQYLCARGAVRCRSRRRETQHHPCAGGHLRSMVRSSRVHVAAAAKRKFRISVRGRSGPSGGPRERQESGQDRMSESGAVRSPQEALRGAAPTGRTLAKVLDAGERAHPGQGTRRRHARYIVPDDR